MKNEFNMWKVYNYKICHKLSNTSGLLWIKINHKINHVRMTWVLSGVVNKQSKIIQGLQCVWFFLFFTIFKWN